MYQIHNPEMPPGFVEAWRAAGKHLQAVLGTKINWLNPSPFNIMGSHLTFMLGNQLFFVFVEIEARPFSTMEKMFTRCASRARARACIMPMEPRGASFQPSFPGTGLIDASTRTPVDPVGMVTDEPIEMSDWEILDFGVQVVAHELEKEGKAIRNIQSHPDIDPSIWFEENGEASCVIVRSVRYPAAAALQPGSARDLARTMDARNIKCWFASVGVRRC